MRYVGHREGSKSRSEKRQSQARLLNTSFGSILSRHNCVMAVRHRHTFTWFLLAAFGMTGSFHCGDALTTEPRAACSCTSRLSNEMQTDEVEDQEGWYWRLSFCCGGEAGLLAFRSSWLPPLLKDDASLFWSDAFNASMNLSTASGTFDSFSSISWSSWVLRWLGSFCVCNGTHI